MDASAADAGAIQQLATLFHAADPTHTGLLSYSEFAYLILKSGGAQEQVDALIDQFSVPSRTSRMVCYAALLQQLGESTQQHQAEDEGEEDTLNARLADVGDDSPLPVPPPQPPQPALSTRTPYAAATSTAASAAATAAAPHSREKPYPLYARRDVYEDSSRSASSTRHLFRPATATPSPLVRPESQMTYREGYSNSTNVVTSRDSSVASLHPRPQRQQQQQQQQHEYRVDESLERQRERSTSSSRTPYQPSSRFVASALRAAQQQGTPQRRSQSSERGGFYPRLEATTLKQHGQHNANSISSDRSFNEARRSAGGRHYDNGKREFYSSSDAVTHSQESPLSPSRSRESSAAVARMMSVAKDAQSVTGNHENSGALKRQGSAQQESRSSFMSATLPTQQDAATLRDTHGGSAAPQLVNRSDSATNSSLHVAQRNAPATRPHDSVLSHASSTSRATLLSLRDVFHRFILPAATSTNCTTSTSGGLATSFCSSAVAEDSSGTVLLSTLERVLAEHGIDVHPLELEAVVDSLELLSNDEAPAASMHNFYSNSSNDNGNFSSVLDSSAVLGRSSVNASAASTGGLNSTVTVTGGADCALGLVDFCVVVSRLRPAVIQRIRSPATWGQSSLTMNASGMNKSRVSSNGLFRETASKLMPSETLTAKSVLEESYETPHGRLQRRATKLPSQQYDGHKKMSASASEAESDEPSIADVTVSPMTPPTTNTTPQSPHASSHLRYRHNQQQNQQQQQQQQQEKKRSDALHGRLSTSLVDSRRPLTLSEDVSRDQPAPSSLPGQRQQHDRRVRSATQDKPAHSAHSLEANLDDPPPTARQLSSDRHFSVLDDTPASASRHTSPFNSDEKVYERDEVDAVWERSRYAQATASSQQHRHTYTRATAKTAAALPRTTSKTPLRRTKEPVWHTNLDPSRTRHTTLAAATAATAAIAAGIKRTGAGTKHSASSSPSSTARFGKSRSASASRSPPSPHSAMPPRRVSINIEQSPLSSASSSLSPPTAAFAPHAQQRQRRAAAAMPHQQQLSLPQRLYDTVQAAATAILLRCTQYDLRRCGCIPRHAWAQVLRDACPSLTPADRQKVESWIERLCRRHTAVRGDVYAEVVEEVLTAAGSAATAAATAAAAITPSSDGSPFHRSVGSASQTQSPLSPSTAATPSGDQLSSRTPVQPSAVPSGLQKDNLTGDDARNGNGDALPQLRDAFLTACGGDLEALQAYFEAFDERQQGYLHAHIWRASVEELFRRTTSREAPAWVLKACDQLARLPFIRVAAQERGADVAVTGSMSLAEKAACGRVRRMPKGTRASTLCDYRYVLQELGLDGLSMQ